MINAYLNDEIIIKKANGVDEWNEPLAATSITVRGRVEYKTRLVRNINGEEVASQVMVMMAKNIDQKLGRALSHEDRLEIIAEGFERSILSILQPKAFSGPHYEVYLA